MVDYIEKASIPLMLNESVSDFQNLMSNALNKEFGDNEHGICLCEVHSKQVVFERPMKENGKTFWRLFVVDYTRDVKTGKFKFSQPVHVRRKTIYTPV